MGGAYISSGHRRCRPEAFVPTLSLDRTYDPAMGNWSACFVRSGTQRIEGEAPPMARRDVGATHSADIQDRSDRRDSENLNSLADKGWDRYLVASQFPKSSDLLLTWNFLTRMKF